MKKRFFFASESFTEGHPDRLCDTISDALVDEYLKQDPYARIITECAISKGVVFVAARFASNATVDIPDIARSVITGVGYREDDFNAADCTVVTSLITMPSEQRNSTDESELADEDIEAMTARNQITLFGFACTQTPELMPLPITLADRLAKELSAARRNGQMPYLSPDCTTQIGVEFDQGRPVRIDNITVIAGLQGPRAVDAMQIRKDLEQRVLISMFAEDSVKPNKRTEIFVNPRGVFPKSGPASHSGMTGRKTASETYGGFARHSGSALSGKDPSRIDRVGAYAARYAAKNVVAAGLAEECEVQLSYALGHAQPVSIQVQTFGTGRVSEDDIQERLKEHFDFRLGAIIRDFQLRHLPTRYKHGFYRQLAAHGHMGRSIIDLPWEKTDKVALLR